MFMLDMDMEFRQGGGTELVLVGIAIYSRIWRNRIVLFFAVMATSASWSHSRCGWVLKEGLGIWERWFTMSMCFRGGLVFEMLAGC